MVVEDVSIRVGVLYILRILIVVLSVGREICLSSFEWLGVHSFLDEDINFFVDGVGWVDNVLVCL